jgi:phosphoglycerate dehydrogenase-like enzyme
MIRYDKTHKKFEAPNFTAAPHVAGVTREAVDHNGVDAK